VNALLALLAEDYTDDKGLNFIEIIFIGFVVFMIPLIIYAVWVSKSDSPWAVKQREANASRQYFDDDDDDDDDGPLEREMYEYYRRENQRGTYPRDWAAEQDRAAYYRRENQRYERGDRD